MSLAEDEKLGIIQEFKEQLEHELEERYKLLVKYGFDVGAAFEKGGIFLHKKIAEIYGIGDYVSRLEPVKLNKINVVAINDDDGTMEAYIFWGVFTSPCCKENKKRCIVTRDEGCDTWIIKGNGHDYSDGDFGNFVGIKYCPLCGSKLAEILPEHKVSLETQMLFCRMVLALDGELPG